jgi:protein required for attachment to host cells
MSDARTRYVKNKNWFLVASQKEVRVFIDVSDRRKRLELVSTIRNPLGDVKRNDLFKRQAGRGIRTVGARGAVHYLDAHRSDPRDQALTQFARYVSGFLESELRRHRFESLTIAAEPHFLGILRAEMATSVNGHVISWLKKDLQKTPARKLADYLVELNKRPNFSDTGANT